MKIQFTVTRYSKQLLNTVMLIAFLAVGQSATAALKNDFAPSGDKGITKSPYQDLSFMRPFKIKVRTGNPGKTDKFKFEIPTLGSGYDYKVDCDSNGIQEATGLTGDYVCEYSTPGDYIISISGDFPRIYFRFIRGINEKDNRKLLSIEQWGNIKWKTMSGAFAKCYIMTSNANDKPDLSDVTDLSYMFEFNRLFNADIGNWDVSNITRMGYMFFNASRFNQDIGSWDVSNVTNMGVMFLGALIFNQDISQWDVSNVTDMDAMFLGARSFNQDISHWDVSNVTDMMAMFHNAYAFNQDIGNWNVSNVTRMIRMFTNARTFNQNIGGWDVSNVVSMNDMFKGASLSIRNYDNLLYGWSRQSLKENVEFHAGNSKYNYLGALAKNRIIDDFGWTIRDSGSAWERYPRFF